MPINRMLPRSFITNITSGDTVPAGVEVLARGIGFGGDAGLSRIDFSADAGKTWIETELGKDEGKYSFRRWQARFTLPNRKDYVLMVRCTNTQRRNTARSAQLEPEWVHAECDRANANPSRLRRKR